MELNIFTPIQYTVLGVDTASSMPTGHASNQIAWVVRTFTGAGIEEDSRENQVI